MQITEQNNKLDLRYHNFKTLLPFAAVFALIEAFLVYAAFELDGWQEQRGTWLLNSALCWLVAAVCAGLMKRVAITIPHQGLIEICCAHPVLHYVRTARYNTSDVVSIDYYEGVDVVQEAPEAGCIVSLKLRNGKLLTLVKQRARATGGHAVLSGTLQADAERIAHFLNVPCFRDSKMRPFETVSS